MSVLRVTSGGGDVSELATETIFTWGAPPIKFGAGALDELPFDLGQLGVERVLIVTDQGVAATGIPERVCRGLIESGLKAEIYDGVHVEPTDESFQVTSVEPRNRNTVARRETVT